MARADVELVARGLATSRTQAQRFIARGVVALDGQPLRRASTPVGAEGVLVVEAGQEYVSRAALKLAGALDALSETAGGGPDLRDARVLDAGASTGGFTEVALRRGARHVVAVDVGSGQLDPRIRSDERVTVLENTNVRTLDPAVVGEPASLLVADLSFISLTLVLAPLLRALTPSAQALLLIKPQFEVGRERLGSGGIVSDPRAHIDAVVGVLDQARTDGLVVSAVMPSPIEGTHGNREFVGWFQREESPAPLSPENRHEHRRLAAGAVSGDLMAAEWVTW